MKTLCIIGFADGKIISTAGCQTTRVLRSVFIMKKIIALIAAVAMIAATVTACGNNNNSSASVGGSTSVSDSK